jgi:membrane dipeptidase
VQSNLVEQCRKVLNRTIVMDMTMPMVPGRRFSQFFSTLDKMRANGVGFVSLTVASDYTSRKEAFRNIRLVKLLLLGRMRRVRFVRDAQDIHKAAKKSKLAVSLHFQGTVPIGQDLSMVRAFYKKGIRHMVMAYNGRNLVGCGCHVQKDEGLTSFGRELIREMNKVGMGVDVAHTGHRTAMETVQTSDKPVFISHGNIWTLEQHPRCAKDELIKAIAAKGGVIGITGLSLFLGKKDVSTQNYVKNIDYVSQLVGTQHVGIGLDYVYDMDSLLQFARNHPEQYPKEGGYFDEEIKQVGYEQIPQIAESLLKLGYSEQNIHDVLGGNWLRVLKQIWV